MPRIRSDNVQAWKRKQEKMVSGYFMEPPVPVDMSNARVFRHKEEGALEKAAYDIQERYGLHTEGF